MKRLLLVGECGAGKRSLIRALSGGAYAPRRPMAVEYYGPFINTPGEFLENRRFYPYLTTASADGDLVAFVLDASRRGCLFPPLFAGAFHRPVIGLIAKIDAETADPARAARLLRTAGAKTILRVSARTGEGLDELRGLLELHPDGRGTASGL